MTAAEITAEWNYDIHSIVLIPRNWSKVKRGKDLYIRGPGYGYEGKFFWDYWHFTGGLDGSLEVGYSDLGVHFNEPLSAVADITEFDYKVGQSPGYWYSEAGREAIRSGGK